MRGHENLHAVPSPGRPRPGRRPRTANWVVTLSAETPTLIWSFRGWGRLPAFAEQKTAGIVTLAQGAEAITAELASNRADPRLPRELAHLGLRCCPRRLSVRSHRPTNCVSPALTCAAGGSAPRGTAAYQGGGPFLGHPSIAARPAASQDA